MLNKIIGSISVRNATFLYEVFKIGFKFHSGKGTLFIESSEFSIFNK